MPPANSTRKISVAPVYFDLYPKVSSSREVFDQPFLSCYASKFYASFSEVASAECQCGWFDPNVKVSNDETLQLVMDLYAHGARMVSLYVAQDCIEDDGTKYIWNALLNPYGEENPRMSVARKIRKFLDIPRNYIIDSVIACGFPGETPLLEERNDTIRYWLDNKNRLHIPKRPLKKIFHYNRLENKK